MKDKIFGVLQRVGRSFMLPIAILPVAGLLLGFGSSFTNATTIQTYGLEKILGDGTILNSLLIIMNKVGSAVFDHLPLIFAVGVAIGMAKKEKEVALEQVLWNCRVALRGFGSFEKNRDSVIGLAFLKFAGDKFEKRRKEIIAEYGDIPVFLEKPAFYNSQNVYYLPEHCR